MTNISDEQDRPAGKTAAELTPLEPPHHDTGAPTTMGPLLGGQGTEYQHGETRVTGRIRQRARNVARSAPDPNGPMTFLPWVGKASSIAQSEGKLLWED